jgi:hypothetical protein
LAYPCLAAAHFEHLQTIVIAGKHVRRDWPSEVAHIAPGTPASARRLRRTVGLEEPADTGTLHGHNPGPWLERCTRSPGSELAPYFAARQRPEPSVGSGTSSTHCVLLPLHPRSSRSARQARGASCRHLDYISTFGTPIACTRRINCLRLSGSGRLPPPRNSETLCMKGAACAAHAPARQCCRCLFAPAASRWMSNAHLGDSCNYW